MEGPSPPPSPAEREGSSGDDYRQTPFLSILLYVLGFMVALGALAFAVVWLLRR